MKTKPQKIYHRSEQIFADVLMAAGKEFFYQPAVFHVNGIQYRPDFYVLSELTFYEVVGSRSAFSLNRQKIDRVREAYPFIKIKIVNPDGTFFKAKSIRKLMEESPVFLKNIPHWDVGRFRGLDVERRRQCLSRHKLAWMTGITSAHQQIINHEHKTSGEIIQRLAKALKRTPDFIRFLIECCPTIQEIEEYEKRNKNTSNQGTFFECLQEVTQK